MKDPAGLENYTDVERISMAATWTDGAYSQLGQALHAGMFNSAAPEAQHMLDTLCDGLWVLGANLGALNLPFPPPVVPAPHSRHLRVVK